jgi:putative ABC transport system permease protein
MSPVAALQMDQQTGGSKMPLRKTLTVFQFAVSIALIACTLVFYRQVHYLQSKERGFDLDGLVVVDINSGILRNKFEAVKQEFSKLPEVKSVSVSSRVPGEWKDFPYVSVVAEGKTAPSGPEMIFLGADQDFLKTYHVKLLEGENFSGIETDSSKILINRLAAQQLGLAQPLGQWVEIPSVNWSGDYETFERPLRVQIAGVVDNFQFEDFRENLKPIVIGFQHNPVQNIDYYTLRSE